MVIWKNEMNIELFFFRDKPCALLCSKCVIVKCRLVLNVDDGFFWRLVLVSRNLCCFIHCSTENSSS